MATLTKMISHILPTPLKRPVRKLRDRLEERRKLRAMFGRLAPMVPPESLMHDGPASYEEFKQNAEEYLQIYRDLAGLRPDERILDVGCGIGRKTIKLTEYLNRNGSYEGIDIVRSGIEWCSRTITRRHPNFRFQTIDTYNPLYNTTSTVLSRDYRFPFLDRSFDFVTLGSVFTHMLTPDVENYLAEIRRVLKPGGRCLISWFLLSPESEALIGRARSTLNMVHELDEVSRTDNQEVPEHAIGYKEIYVLDLYRKLDFREDIAVHHGSWCGRSKFLTYQDLILAYTS